MREIDESHVVDLQRLVVENIDSYQAKLESITNFMEGAATLIERISAEQDEIVLKLREKLAKWQCLRKRDFDHMFRPLREKRQAGFEEATRVIEDFRKGEYQMLARWHGLICGKEELKLSDFGSVKEELLAGHDLREAEVIRAIRNFNLQQEELLAGLKELAAKGDGVRIGDFKGMIRSLDAREMERGSEMGELLEELREAAHVVRDDWGLIFSAGGQGA